MNFMTTKLVSFFAIAAIAVISFSCTKDKLAPSYAEIEICFETEILPIFVSNCAMASGCHNSTDKEDGYDLTRYSGIMTGISTYNSSGSKHIKYIKKTDSDRIPEPPYDLVPTASIALIEAWINKGAPNTIDCTVTACDTLANISLATTMQSIINTNCLGCHGSGSGGDYNYSTYAGKGSIDDGSFMGFILHQSPYVAMPLNSGQLSTCDIQNIQTWINEGAANN
jgi:hypothetical protein